MHRKIKQFLKNSRLAKWHEKKLVNSLKTSGCFVSKNPINEQKKEIYLGFYGLIYELMDPINQLKVQLLVKWHNYKPLEERIEFKLF